MPRTLLMMRVSAVGRSASGSERGPRGARDEFLLAATAQNLRKLAESIRSCTRTSRCALLPPIEAMRCRRGSLIRGWSPEMQVYRRHSSGPVASDHAQAVPWDCSRPCSFFQYRHHRLMDDQTGFLEQPLSCRFTLIGICCYAMENPSDPKMSRCPVTRGTSSTGPSSLFSP